MVMVFNTTFNNISVISWQSVFLAEETGVPGENYHSSQTITLLQIYIGKTVVAYSTIEWFINYRSWFVELWEDCQTWSTICILFTMSCLMPLFITLWSTNNLYRSEKTPKKTIIKKWHSYIFLNSLSLFRGRSNFQGT